jgi:sarcosine oxidase subunit beta
VTDKGRIPAGKIVIAAGVLGNELLKPLGHEVPMQVPMVTVLRSAPTDRILQQVIGVANADCAGRQEHNGRFRVSGSLRPWHGVLQEQQTRSGLQPRVNPTGSSISEAAGLFGHVVPSFAAARIEEIWAGLVDLTPDALPVIDGSLDIEGLVVAMGFSGHGFGLGPITGRILCDLVQDRPPRQPIGPFGIRRFSMMRNLSERATLLG